MATELGLDSRLRGNDGGDFIKTFPCGGCGAKLSFAPGTRELKCEFCGARNAIAENDARVEELPNNLVDVHLAITEGKRARLRAINDAVVYSVNGPSALGASGLSIYFPPESAYYDPAYDEVPAAAR